MTYLLTELWLFLIVSCALGFGLGWWCRRIFVESPRVEAWEKKYNSANLDREDAQAKRRRAEHELSELTETHARCAPEIATHLATIEKHEAAIEALQSDKTGLQEELKKGNQLLIALKNAESKED